jgi:hypothetical protein
MSENRSLSGATAEYTEDDTFRVLARPKLEQMMELHAAWKRKIHEDGAEFNTTWNIAFMKHHGWTWVEYLTAKHHAGYLAV